MAGDVRHEFNEAVRECLANCYRTDLPVAALAEYVEVLKRRDWTPAEIHKVEAAVLKILLAVVSKSERDDLVNRIIKPRGLQQAASGGGTDKLDSGTKHSQNKSSGNEKPLGNGGSKARSDRDRASGNVLPSDFYGVGDSAIKRS